jgi:hypothetical protein
LKDGDDDEKNDDSKSLDYWIQNPWDVGDLMGRTVWLPALHRAIMKKWRLDGRLPSKATIQIIVSAVYASIAILTNGVGRQDVLNMWPSSGNSIWANCTGINDFWRY